MAHSEAMKWIGILALAPLFGCTPEPRKAVSDRPIVWEEAPSGSKFRLERNEYEGFSAPLVERCWPRGAGFICVSARGMQADGGTIWTISRVARPRLPSAGDPDPPESQSPYSCKLSNLDAGRMLEEEISKDGGNGAKITGNVIEGPLHNRTAWRKSYVEALVRDNNLGENDAYFQCARIARIIEDGSLESLGTTLLSKSVLD